MAAREAALQMIYALEVGGGDAAQVALSYRQSHPLPEPVGQQAEALLRTAAEQRPRIEDLIQRNSVGWRLERMSVIDRSLLKLATAEMLTGQPRVIVVQTTVRLARKFSQPEAISFLQGLLEAVAREVGDQTEVANHAQ